MVTNERRHNTDIAFHEDEVKLAKRMMDTLRTTVEFLYYLMDHRNRASFTMILISTDGLKLDTMLQNWKRETDILFEIDKTNNVYVLICQSTDHEGAEKFAEILLSNIHVNGGTSTYCVAAELKSTNSTIQEVIFTMVEKYMAIKKDHDSERIFFTRVENRDPDSTQDIIYK
ncbi:hypothetical protein MNB_SV-8-257 [hydrothermal vent metagenome]|uniref:GGDEF domain-containing protein n=1 Tax=hydrothermal vent metagenome TaxID=652676 RepID=A0A1W1C085_9ZZZZ